MSFWGSVQQLKLNDQANRNSLQEGRKSRIMHSSLNEARHGKSSDESGNHQDVTYRDENIKTKLREIENRIPKGYFIGLSQEHTRLICCVLYYLFKQESGLYRNSQFVLDIGSGKGYIDRILSSYYKIGVFCVEAEKERLESSTRLQRLLNDDKTTSCDTPISGRSEPLMMKSCQYRLQTHTEFQQVWDQSLLYFRQLGGPVSEIIILALKVCGNMFYDIVDWVLTNYNHLRASLPHECRLVKVFIVPCCLEKSSRLRIPAPCPTSGASFELELQQLLVRWVQQRLADTSGTAGFCSVEARKCPGPTSYFGIEMALPFPTKTVVRACPR